MWLFIGWSIILFYICMVVFAMIGLTIILFLMSVFAIDTQALFALLSGKISTAINRKLYRNFRKMNIDITPEQWTVLYYLWSKDGVTQQELCNTTFKDKPSMTRLIDNLEKQGLVTRSSDARDRRINIIRLTEKGSGLEEVTQALVVRGFVGAVSGGAGCCRYDVE